MRLETERLLLRAMQPDDIPALVRLWTDPEVTRYMGGPREPAYLEKVFAEDLNNPTPDTYDLWPVIEKASSRLVGHCGLTDKEIEGKPEIELVYVIAKSAWGKGYATEIALALKQYAQEQMGPDRLVALIDPVNAGSEGVALKVGLHFEREVTRPGGKVMKLYAVNIGVDVYDRL